MTDILDLKEIQYVDELIRQMAGADFLGKIVDEHLKTGGKRLRAKVALAAHSALTGTVAKSAIAWAAACETLHNATLIHDDLQDGDEVRRGQPTVWKKYGAAQAINAGDLLFVLPFVVMDSPAVPEDIHRHLGAALARGAAQVIRGQAAELLLTQEQNTDRQNYLSVIEGKTSALFRIPVEGAALLAGYSPPESVQLAAAFSLLGVVFQLQDDVLDLFGEKGRGKVGADLREGKISALVVEYVSLVPGDRGWLLDLLRKSRDATPDVDVLAAKDRFEKSGALAAVVQQIRNHCARALATPALKKEAKLRELAEALATKILEPIAVTMQAHS